MGANPLLPGNLPGLLPPGTYSFANAPHDTRLAALAFALGSYRFSRYRKREDKLATLVVPDGIDAADLSRIADGITLARDLINTPSNDMGPAELHEATRLLAERHDAWIEAVTDSELLLKNFPLIHAVGRASSRPPRLIDLRWGDRKAPKVTLVGKGVCFDTGGLDLKPESAMLLMKKDMGGAATVLALAHMIMDRKLPVSLRVLIPAVENSVSGSAFRPLDVYPSRKGITVEIGNTDAEGRLVLADALALADEEKPDLLIDFGTLTGAARVALGPELVPFYTGDDTLAAALSKHAAGERDPLWRMPLWEPYESMLDFEGRRHQQCCDGRLCRLGHLRLVPQEVRVQPDDLAAFRHLRLESGLEARPAGRRRVPGCARGLCLSLRTLRIRPSQFDSRITPARADLAAKHLEGQVEAERFVDGELCEVFDPIAPLRREPVPDAALDTEALKGERIMVYDVNDEGWCWGQLQTDGYVGWLPTNALMRPGAEPTHKVRALRTFVFPAPNIKAPPIEALPFGAQLAIVRVQEPFAVTANGGFVPTLHICADHRISRKIMLPSPNASSVRPICGAASRRSASIAPA